MLDHERTHRAVKAATNHTTIPIYYRFEVEGRRMNEALNSMPHLYYWSPQGCVDLYGKVFPAHFLVTLDNEEMRIKREGLSAHTSQREWLKRHYGVDQYIAMMEKWAGLWITHFNLEKESEHRYAEAFAQDLSPGFPRTDILRKILKDRLLPTKTTNCQPRRTPSPAIGSSLYKVCKTLRSRTSYTLLQGSTSVFF